MGELSKLPNIGAIVEQQLNAVGILTAEDLRSTGSKEAWLRIKAIDSSAMTGSTPPKEQFRYYIFGHNLKDG